MSKAHGQLGCIAHRRVAPLCVMPQMADDHPSRVEPHADGVDAFWGLPILGQVLTQALVQHERRSHCSPCMILLGHGRAKYSRESLTGLVDERALVVLQHLLN
jgi:hypothetical protein